MKLTRVIHNGNNVYRVQYAHWLLAIFGKWKTVRIGKSAAEFRRLCDAQDCADELSDFLSRQKHGWREVQ